MGRLERANGAITVYHEINGSKTRSTLPMTGPPSYRRCALCDCVITRRPIFIDKDWYCRHCGKAKS